VARYVARSMQVLGCSWDSDASSAGADGDGASREQVVAPFLDALTAFRCGVRAALCVCAVCFLA
jgi:hypothetical protein